MGFAIAQTQNTSSLLTEIVLADPEAEETLESQEVSEEAVDEQVNIGTLRAESKEYVLIKQLASDIPRTFSDSLLTFHHPKQNKLADPKSAPHSPAFKKEHGNAKNCKTIESHQPRLEKKFFHEQKLKQNSLPERAHQSAKQSLSSAKYPPTAAKMRENILKQQQHTSISAQQRIQKELNRKDQTKEQQIRSEQHPSLFQSNARWDNNRDKQEERERKNRDEQDGFGGGEQHTQQDNSSEQENTPDQNSPIESLSKEFNSYAVQESILSQIFNMRISQFDVLILFLEILKLDIKNRELQMLARREERELQIMHMQKVVENYKTQGNWQFAASLGSGILAIVSGVAPIVGYMKGNWIIEKLSSFDMFSSMRGMDQEKFFKGLKNITYAMSEMQKSTGQIQETFSEGHRTFDQHMSEIYKSDWEESNRIMDEIKGNWKSIEDFLYQTLQMYHDSIRSLYN